MTSDAINVDPDAPGGPDGAPQSPPPARRRSDPWMELYRRPDRDPGRRRRLTRTRFMARARSDPHLLLAIALALAVIGIELFPGNMPSPLVLAASVAFVALQAVLTTGGTVVWPAPLRLALALAFVLFVNAQDQLQAIGPLSALQVPVVALAAALGSRGSLAVAGAGFVATVAPIVIQGVPDPVRQEALALAMAEVVLAIGSRRLVASLEHSIRRAQEARARDRRRARQIGAVEEVGRILAQEGPTGQILARVMDVLETTFGYHYPSVYLWDGSVLRLGAQRNYANPIDVFEPTRGVIGRVARTRKAVFLAEVAGDPDYLAADPAVNGEISVPMISGESLLGVLNVESDAQRRLDTEDLATMEIIGDRLGAALALADERQKLSERAALLGRLAETFAILGGTLDLAALHAAIARVATTLVDCDVGLLTLADRSDGTWRTAASHGADMPIGMKIDPGEGATGRAIAMRAPVLDDHLERSQFPRAAQRVGAAQPEVAIMAMPMLRDDVVLGVITFVRFAGRAGFTAQEREVAGLLAAQTILAIANASQHAATQEAAIRDPLTGLHNRRLLDDVVARMGAVRVRQTPEERRPVAAILFDLDHFGDLNNRQGHAAGDAVLRAFGALLASRFRASDLVARYGGEEFLVVLDGASRDDAVRSAEAVRVAFRDTTVFGPSGEELRATVSAGCAALDPGVAALDSMVELADVGLALAKAGGRDQVVAA